MSITAINGIMGIPDKSDSPNVRFNLTVDSETQKVHGSVQIFTAIPKDFPYNGNVSGTLHKLQVGNPTDMLIISGMIPGHDPLNPGIKVPFNANIVLEADGKGFGALNFLMIHKEQMPVTYQGEAL